MRVLFSDTRLMFLTVRTVSNWLDSFNRLPLQSPGVAIKILLDILLF